MMASPRFLADDQIELGPRFWRTADTLPGQIAAVHLAWNGLL